MGSKGRTPASVSGGQAEDNTGGHHPESFDSAAAADAAGPEEDFDAAVAEAASGSDTKKNSDSDKAASLYPVAEAYRERLGRPAPSRSRQREIEEGNRRTLNTLIEKRTILDDDLLQKKYIRDSLKNRIYELECRTNQPRAEDYIVAFVKEIVRENEVLVFEDYLKKRDDIIEHGSNEHDILKILIQKEKVHKDYKELSFQDIAEAINRRIVALIIEQYRKEHELKAATENISISLEEDSRWFWLRSVLCEDGHKDPRLNPIGELIKAIRQKEYIMDTDPLKELYKIEVKNQVFYFNHFRRKMTTKYSKNQVQVNHVPLDFDEEQVKAAFSVCGEIVDVTLERGGPWSKVAYVTFKESEGAKIAPFLMDPASFSILPVCVPHKYTENARTRRELKNARRRYEEFRSGKF